MDGRWVAAGAPGYRWIQQTPIGVSWRYLPDDAPSVETVDIVYNRFAITLAGREMIVLVVKGMDPGDVLVRLLEGYRGRQSA